MYNNNIIIMLMVHARYYYNAARGIYQALVLSQKSGGKVSILLKVKLRCVWVPRYHILYLRMTVGVSVNSPTKLTLF